MQGNRLGEGSKRQDSSQAVHPQRDTTSENDVEVTGHELIGNSTRQQNREKSAKRDGKSRNLRETDPALQEVMNRLDSQPETIRNAIMAMVETLERRRLY
jgi:hypothetical protein